MALTDDEIAVLQAKAAKADEIEGKLTALESKAKGYDEVKADMLRYKTQLNEKAEAEAKLERERLERQGEFKTLLEKSEADKTAALKKAEDSEQLAQRFIRFSALKEEAAKAGIRPEALADLGILQIDKLEIQREGQNISVKGADALIAEAKKNRPHWFGAGTAPNVDTGKGGTGGSKGSEGLSLLELARKDPAAFKVKMAELVASKA